MAKIKGAVVIDKEVCKGCNLCVAACALDVLTLHKEVNSKGYNYSYMSNPDACTGCINCALVCPDSCITVYRVKPQKVA
jgi:2-oxoglutarate ferredoxin oxidoreductase subunit delta